MKIPGIKDNTEYKAFVCRRCKEVHFAEFKDCLVVMPDGWTFLEGTLCPECTKKFEKLKEDFFANKNNI